MSRRKGRRKNARPKEKVAYGSDLPKKSKGRRKMYTSSERTLETLIPRQNVKDMMHTSIAQFMTASGFIWKDDDLVDFDLKALLDGEENVKITFKIDSTKGTTKKSNDEAFEI